MESKNLQEIQELKVMIQEMSKLINYDSLTELPNELLLKSILKKSIANVKRNDHSIALILLDINNLHDIIESYGQNISDEFLKSIAQILTNCVREGDVVAKIEESKFAILLEQLHDEAIVAKIVNKILTATLSTHKLSNGITINIHSNAGVSLSPKDSTNSDELLYFSNITLDEAKHNSNDTYRFYTDEITQKAIKRIAYEETLKNALIENRIKLHYQPIIDLKTEKIVSAEVLLRWTCKEYGNVAPDIFIPLADETGLIHKIGYYLIDEATAELKKLNDDGFNISFSLNLSTNQIKYQNILAILKGSMEKNSYKAYNLSLEISEDALLSKGEDALQMLKDIKTFGAKISLDRFGSGYSSITNLKKFPIDSVKIDSTFTEDKKLLTSMIQMAKALNLQVIGQRIEHSEDREFLKENGCDLYQGFIRSKAVSIEDLREMLKEQNS